MIGNKINISEVYNTSWNPKQPNRFIAKLFLDDKIFVPSHIIKGIGRPEITQYNKSNNIVINMYEVLGYNTYFKLFNTMGTYPKIELEVKELHPTGEVAEIWVATDCAIVELTGPDLDWAGHTDIAIIQLKLSFDKIVIKE